MEDALESKTKPSYYGSDGFDLISFAFFNDLPFIEGNVMKYVMRWRMKNGIEDLYKAREYLDRLIEYVSNFEEGDGPNYDNNEELDDYNDDDDDLFDKEDSEFVRNFMNAVAKGKTKDD